MKKFLIVVLSLGMLLLSACSASDPYVDSQPSAIAGALAPEESGAHQTESENPEKEAEDISSFRNSKENDREKPESEKQDTDIASQAQNTDGSSKTASDSSSSEREPARQQEEAPARQKHTEPEQPPTPPVIKNAGASDTQAVADKVLQYINQHRSVSAVKLSGLTKYAQYRSKQLVSNFAHDTNDQRAAATALQYGEYIDPSQFGGIGTPYYRAGAREAIVKSGCNGTVEQVAENLAGLVHNSSGHWAYIGSSEYSYIAVGVTYEGGMWYCDIAVAEENTDEY